MRAWINVKRGKLLTPYLPFFFLCLFPQLAGAENWYDIADFVEWNEDILGQYVDLTNGCPSHDTYERVIGMLSESQFQELNKEFQSGLEFVISENMNRLICLDGKTMRGNKSSLQKANHIVTALDSENRLSLGQVKVDEKSNEITAIPRLLRLIDIQKSIVTMDAMGTQTEIVQTIVKGNGDYCLAVKGNQETLFEDLVLYFSDAKILEKLKQRGHYHTTCEKARGQIETREYYVSSDVAWLCKNHPNWKKLKGIGMTRNVIDHNGAISEEIRYFIFSFKADVALFSHCVRGHWSIESFHWLLDVVYREDHNQTLHKTAAANLNALRKICLHFLRTLSFPKKNMSYRRKTKYIASHPEECLKQLFGE